ncbi:MULTISPECIES: hypothetical protein [unclassified Aeromicrobium]|uniref:hypothetical protein n=1 Tax=unclassified Aeromicrobium TaxID=2633570 RepID=UPI00396AF4C9
MAVLSAYLAAGAALGWLVNLPHVALGIGWVLAAATAVAAAMSVTSIRARLGFAAAALLTAYLAYAALGPMAGEENAYIFLALRVLPVVGVIYAVALVLAHRATPARRSE